MFWNKPKQPPRPKPVDPYFYGDGTPKSLGSLSTHPALNRPYGEEEYGNVGAHLRSCYGLIAQLRDRVEVLEKECLAKVLDESKRLP